MEICNATRSCTGWAFPPGLGWTTFPSPDKDLGWATIVLNVLFSLMPMLFVFYAPIFVVRLIFDSRNGELYQTDELSKTLAKSQLALKYFSFSIVVPLLNFLQKLLFVLLLPCSMLLRPSESCLSSSGMPDEWSVWTGGIFALVFIDVMMCWSVPHLTMSENCEPVYTKDQLLALGYTEISAHSMVKWLLVVHLLLGPVPLSRIIVRDATYFQVLAGLAEGTVLALALHVGRVRMLDSGAEEAVQHRVTRFMVKQGCRSKAARASWSKVQHLEFKDQLWRLPGLLWREIPTNARSEADTILNGSTLNQPLMGDEESASSLGSKSMGGTPKAQKQRRQWRSSADVPGLEFLGPSTTAVLEAVRKEFKQRSKELNQFYNVLLDEQQRKFEGRQRGLEEMQRGLEKQLEKQCEGLEQRSMEAEERRQSLLEKKKREAEAAQDSGESIQEGSPCAGVAQGNPASTKGSDGQPATPSNSGAMELWIS